MNNNNIINKSEITRLTRKVEKIVNSFDNAIDDVFCEYFAYVHSLSYYSFYRIEDNEVVEKKLEKYMKRFKLFCEKYSRFKTFNRFTLLPKEVEITVDDSFEFTLNYERSGTFINRHKLLRFVENIINVDEFFEVDPSYSIEINEDQAKLTDCLKELKENLSYDNTDIIDLKSSINTLIQSLTNLEFKQYYMDLESCRKLVQDKHEKYFKKILS